MDSQRVVIVGAGITGCSTAYQLAARGFADVTVLDKGHVASGPTGYSSGVVRQFYTDPVLVQMALQGRDTYANFSERVSGQDAGFRQCGWLLAVGDRNREIAERGLAIEADVGVKSSWVSPAEVAELVPGITADGLVGGVYEAEAGYADPPGAAQGYLTAARALGVVYQPRSQVLALLRRGEDVVGVETTEGPLEADVVVVAAGPWTAALTAPLGQPLPVTPSRHSIVTVRERQRPARPVFSDPVNLVYIRPEGSSLTLIGSNEPSDAHDVVDPDCSSATADDSKVEQMLTGSSVRLPAIADAEVTASWSGIYDVSGDGFPLLGALPGVQGLLIATGMSGHGFKLAPAIGQILASAIVDSDPDPRMHMFRPQRFAEGDLVQSVTTSSLTSMRGAANDGN